MIVWARLEYGPKPIIAHKRITITLPFTIQNEATHLIPMGETIEHPFPGGHPGIDFQWDHAVPLIAVADGKISKINRAEDLGEPVWDVTLKSGEYIATYKELETYAPSLKEGAKIKQGDLIGYPHCIKHEHETGCQVHWEFAYGSFFMPKFAGQPDRLCPVTYFDAPARARIEKIWANVPAQDQFKKDFPYICSNVYYNHDQ